MNSGAFDLLLPLGMFGFCIVTSGALLNWIKQAELTSVRKISLQLFLGAFAKLRKSPINFVMSVSQYVRPLGTTRLSMH